MTIALGVVCSDGVVLGTDLMYSTGGFLQTPGQKIFVLKPSYDPRLNYSVVIAGSDNSDSAKYAVERMDEILADRFTGVTPTVKQIKACLTDALIEMFAEHIKPAPPDERKAIRPDLLVAIRVGRECRLYRQNRTMLVEERNFACRGIGLYLANYILDVLLDRNPTVQRAAQIVSYVIGAASEYLQGIGKGSDIHILDASGTHWGLHAPQVREIQAEFAALLGSFRYLVEYVDSRSISEEFLPSALERLGDKVKNLRALQEGRIELRLKHLSEIQSGQLLPESPKHDPKPLPPSPE
jgi:hypothetical protein